MKPETKGQEKHISVKAKVTSSSDEGIVTAVVSVWGNVDAYGDVMIKGAFTKTLEEWEAANASIPFLWSHKIDDLNAYIGIVTDARETDEGLEVDVQFDLDDKDSKKAYNLLKSGRIKEFSFGFIVRDADFSERDGEQVREVKDVELLEVSMTMIGANRATRVVAVKEAPEQSEEKTAVVEETAVFTLADLDNAIAAVKAVSDTANETLLSLTEAREAIATKSIEDEEVVEETVAEETEDEEVVEIDKQAAVDEVEIDEEPSEVKSSDADSTAAKAQELEIKQALIELERMIQK